MLKINLVKFSEETLKELVDDQISMIIGDSVFSTLGNIDSAIEEKEAFFQLQRNYINENAEKYPEFSYMRLAILSLMVLQVDLDIDLITVITPNVEQILIKYNLYCESYTIDDIKHSTMVRVFKLKNTNFTCKDELIF